MGLVHGAAGQEPAEFADDPGGDGKDDHDGGFERAEDRRFLCELHGYEGYRRGGREGDRAGTGADRGGKERGGITGRGGTTAGERDRRDVSIRIAAGCERQFAGDRDGEPGRIGTAGARLLPARRREVEEAARRLCEAREETVRTAGRPGGQGRGRSERGDGHRDVAGQGVDVERGSA